MSTVSYSDSDIKTLEWDEHIRRRPGMYIGKLGDGTYPDDGIYVLLKEVLDNSIDEFVMGAGKHIRLDIADGSVVVRDFGRGIPMGKLVDATSKMNTGGKIDSKAFKKSVGLNGVGIKAVNALSSLFKVTVWRDGSSKSVTYAKAQLLEETEAFPSEEKSGTEVRFTPDNSLFKNYHYRDEYVIAMVKNYVFLNAGLTVTFNGKTYYSKEGLSDLLRENMTGEALYPIIHLRDSDIEVVVTHTQQYGEEFYSFVNGQNTTQGGTHLSAFREAVARVIKEFFAKNFEYSDIRSGMSAAISLKVEEPVFESQTKTKLGSRDMYPDGPTIQKFVGDFLKKELDNYLHIHSEDSEAMLRKIQESERERKAMSGVTKLARERAKKSNLHNRKLRDCTTHFNDPKAKEPERTSIFITEGNSASGSITTSRDPAYQAVFSLLGKPLNSFGLTKKVVYENEEFNLLQAALNIEDGIEGLRYNRVIIATDADNDGMHIRLLLITFFLQFFPDLVRRGHVFVLETPLFKVALPKEGLKGRSFSDKSQKRKSKTISIDRDTPSVIYCYSEAEKQHALRTLGKRAHITRFKGLGEISADEFKELITEENIKLEPVRMKREDNVTDLLAFYMGKNTPKRQDFIIDNLVVDEEML
ncbi:DNA topoisomerase IV subunit B [Porphyromonas crevioricanis]|uniref:DNA topoisomerase (ATP-hydrolyzing) n=1 Tax=Porphyromonas crevioricanis TaxID=393921 RepID=A0A0A2G3H3_9PORP|nr:DNA topoisomerase IV subunit B [Porphyromonas crevioricanis]KGN90890.1 DNA topoisomerase IV subunit B [Porphyromonas crevioricanis]KGN95039.1 DNA topoisomerase IV subunit B [Porphyromonas crevioricanis]GAD06775.1 topoisomerase IV subunit B [Porphyromonas crevioricanis JCM 13913]SQH73268.1 DNA gyrase subunit B [Porphyromonas crevioricanis]